MPFLLESVSRRFLTNYTSLEDINPDACTNDIFIDFINNFDLENDQDVNVNVILLKLINMRSNVPNYYKECDIIDSLSSDSTPFLLANYNILVSNIKLSFTELKNDRLLSNLQSIYELFYISGTNNDGSGSSKPVTEGMLVDLIEKQKEAIKQQLAPIRSATDQIINFLFLVPLFLAPLLLASLFLAPLFLAPLFTSFLSTPF